MPGPARRFTSSERSATKRGTGRPVTLPLLRSRSGAAGVAGAVAVGAVSAGGAIGLAGCALADGFCAWVGPCGCTTGVGLVAAVGLADDAGLLEVVAGLWTGWIGAAANTAGAFGAGPPKRGYLPPSAFYSGP